MNEDTLFAYIGVALLLGMLIPCLLFLYTQQQTLKLIRPENRTMNPGQVWLQLIPGFGLVYQFAVIGNLSKSLRQELVTPIDDSLFDGAIYVDAKPTYTAGITAGILFCCSILPIPIIKSIISMVALGAWINYWVQINRYKKILQQRISVYAAAA